MDAAIKSPTKKFDEQFATLKDLFKAYRATQRCLPSFNVNDNYDMKAVIEAANAVNTNVMVMTYPPVVELNSAATMKGLADGMRKNANNAVYLHLDHSTSIDMCKQAIDEGYDSVMIDGSHLPIEQNIAATKEVVDYAASANVLVEAEVGRIMGRDVVANTPDDFLASVADVKRLYESTGADIIAVGIGTAHGFTPEEPKIYFDRLKEISEAIPAPLVLHGGTGIPDADIRHSMTMGISKINIGTIVHTTYMRHALEHIKAAGDGAYPPYVMKEVLPEIIKVVIDRLNAVNY